MGRRYLSLQLNDGLYQLTSVQMLGKIFIGSVYNLASANLNTRGGAPKLNRTMEALLPLAYLPSSPLMLRPQDKIDNPLQLLHLHKGRCSNQLYPDQYLG